MRQELILGGKATDAFGLGFGVPILGGIRRRVSIALWLDIALSGWLCFLVDGRAIINVNGWLAATSLSR